MVDLLVVGLMARMMMSLKLGMNKVLGQRSRGPQWKGETHSARIGTDRLYRKVERVVVQGLKEEVPRYQEKCHTLTVGGEGNKLLEVFKGESVD